MAEIRAAIEADIDALIAVKDAATEGWEIPRTDGEADRLESQRILFAHLLRTGHAAVAVEEGAPIGFANAIVREDVWFLSQLFVRPEAQSRGTGAALLDDLLTRPDAVRARVRAVLSSDDPRAFGLYLSRGMLPDWSMIQFTRRASPRDAPRPAELSPLVDGDMAGVDDLDRTVRGFARTVDHGLLATIATGYAVRAGGRLGAYVYVHPGGRVGPLVARDDDALLGTIDAADVLAGGEASWSAASRSLRLVGRLLDLGYRPIWQSTFCSDGPVGPFDRVSLAGGALL